VSKQKKTPKKRPQPAGCCFTLPSLAKHWRCRRETVSRMIERGELGAFVLGSGKRTGVRIAPEAVKLVESRRAVAMAPAPAPRRRAKPTNVIEFF
jgi:hypothetical protein